MSSPSLAEIAAAMKVLKDDPPNSIARHVPTLLVALVIGIGAWLMTSMNSMQTSMTQVVTTVAAIQKQVDQMSQRSDAGAQNQVTVQTAVARLEQRVSQNESRLNAMDGRGMSSATGMGAEGTR